VPDPLASPNVRLTELLVALSLVGDLGMGQPMEHALRQCLIASRLGERIGIDDQARAGVYYAGLLAWVGCHVDAYEEAKWFGDDMALKAGFRLVDFSGPVVEAGFMLRHLGAGRPLVERARTGMGFLGGGGMKDADTMLQTHWLAADALAASVGLDDDVRKSIEQTFERWDGRGVPHGAKGENILLTSRLVNLADVVVVYHRLGGVEAAVEVARQRRGTQFDPGVVDAFCEMAADLFAELEATPTWEAVMAAEPLLSSPLTDEAFDAALEAMADFADVKSPYTLGHSRGVADLAADAAANLGMPSAEVTTVRRAGLVHDLGRLGVSNGIWDKVGELSLAESERVRLHPYLTERTLAFSPALAPLGAVAIQHHERLDGSGYPRGLRADAITPAGRVLGAADAYRASTEPRPHRPASTPAEAASKVRAEVRAGRLDGDAVEAVTRAAGHRARRRPAAVAGLTSREVDVLRLLALGLSNKQIARRLAISAKTAGNHIEHIYTKLGVTNRALASLFAARQGLLDPADG
jgi:HD-GYP domain-containing protein (c-di-GMP phosphodiesterase class II)